MNIVLIVVDTLRADHLSCYNYFRETCPTMDKIACEGILFENFYASGIPTGPGFTSIITGLYPVNHKYYITPWDIPNTYQLDDNIPVLAEILWDHGYVTAAVDNLINFRSHMKQFVRGFEYYLNPTKSSRWIHHCVIADQVNKKVIPWIKEHSYERFFLFIHYWDPHTPYNQPEGYRHVFKHKKMSINNLKVEKAKAGYEYIPGWGKIDEIIEGNENKSINLYDGEILYVDNAIAEVVEALKDEGILNDTLLIITSDHGEQLGQHGIWGHAGLHESVIRIPLIIRCPEKLPKGLRVKQLAQQVDILPTILDIAHVKTGFKFDGESLMRLIKGGNIRDFIICETWGERCIIYKNWKLIVHYEAELKVLHEIFPKPFQPHHFKPIKTILEKITIIGNRGYELYNIDEDPMEVINLAEEERDKLKELERMLDDWVKAKVGKNDPMDQLERYTQPQPLEYQRI